jgi:hypothetical protein
MPITALRSYCYPTQEATPDETTILRNERNMNEEKLIEKSGWMNLLSR